MGRPRTEIDCAFQYLPEQSHRDAAGYSPAYRGAPILIANEIGTPHWA